MKRKDRKKENLPENALPPPNEVKYFSKLSQSTLVRQNTKQVLMSNASAMATATLGLNSFALCEWPSAPWFESLS